MREDRPDRRDVAGKPALFADLPFDAAQYDEIMTRSGPKITYGIFFTPRSGSTWLSDVLTSTLLLGKPREFFNPTFVPQSARSLGVDTLERYIDMIQRKSLRRRVFGFEITYGQLVKVFGTEREFLRLFPAALPYFYLTRQDIVLQAVSLAKAVGSSVFHSKGTESGAIARSDAAFDYDPQQIKIWLGHIHAQEVRFELFFDRHQITPLRLSYEQITALGAEAVIALFAGRIGIRAALAVPPAEEQHRKIGTGKNDEFAARFRVDQADYCARIDANRFTGLRVV